MRIYHIIIIVRALLLNIPRYCHYALILTYIIYYIYTICTHKYCMVIFDLLFSMDCMGVTIGMVYQAGLYIMICGEGRESLDPIST